MGTNTKHLATRSMSEYGEQSSDGHRSSYGTTALDIEEHQKARQRRVLPILERLSGIQSEKDHQTRYPHEFDQSDAAF